MKWSNEAFIKGVRLYLCKGKLAIKQNATKPNLNSNGIVNIKQGRHPLWIKKQ